MCALAAERCADRACSSSVSSRWRGSRLPETAEAGPAADPEGADDEHDRSSDCRASRALSLDPARGPRQLATASGEKTKAAEAGDDAGGGGLQQQGRGQRRRGGVGGGCEDEAVAAGIEGRFVLVSFEAAVAAAAAVAVAVCCCCRRAVAAGDSALFPLRLLLLRRREQSRGQGPERRGVRSHGRDLSAQDLDRLGGVAAAESLLVFLGSGAR